MSSAHSVVSSQSISRWLEGFLNELISPENKSDVACSSAVTCEKSVKDPFYGLKAFLIKSTPIDSDGISAAFRTRISTSLKA